MKTKEELIEAMNVFIKECEDSKFACVIGIAGEESTNFSFCGNTKAIIHIQSRITQHLMNMDDKKSEELAIDAIQGL